MPPVLGDAIEDSAKGLRIRGVEVVTKWEGECERPVAACHPRMITGGRRRQKDGLSTTIMLGEMPRTSAFNDVANGAINEQRLVSGCARDVRICQATADRSHGPIVWFAAG